MPAYSAWCWWGLGTVVAMLVLLDAVIVDVGAEVVAIVAIGSTSRWSTFTSGAQSSPLSCPASSGAVGSRCGVRP
jgi:hypothetical protein